MGSLMKDFEPQAHDGVKFAIEESGFGTVVNVSGDFGDGRKYVETVYLKSTDHDARACAVDLAMDRIVSYGIESGLLDA